MRKIIMPVKHNKNVSEKTTVVHKDWYLKELLEQSDILRILEIKWSKGVKSWYTEHHGDKCNVLPGAWKSDPLLSLGL